jgi:phage shock protein A
MSILRRMSDVFQQKVNSAIDKAEDPSQALDLSYQKQLEALQQVRRNVADVLTSEKRLELQAAQMQQQVQRLQDQAKAALQQGREDLARLALTRAQGLQAQLDGLNQQVVQLKDQEQKLEVTAQKLQAKIEAFRMQKDTMKAQYTAAKASTQVGEQLTGLSEQIADASMMVDRSREKIAQMQARSAAIDQLVDSGVLDQLGASPGDDIDPQLAAASSEANVNAQLESMKQSLALPEATTVVRVQGDDQYRLSQADKQQLEAYDQKLVAAINSGDEGTFKQAVADVLKFVRSRGTRIGDSEVATSDVLLPAEDMSLEEAKQILAGV